VSNFEKRPLGAILTGDGTQFRVWAPVADDVTLVLDGSEGDDARSERLDMEPAGAGYFERFVDGLGPGARYRFDLGEAPEPFPDPAGRFQPEGVHGPSEVIDPSSYDWQTPDWGGVAQENLVFYELHVGAFTPEGTFDAAREKLGFLKDLGVTAVELMPVGAFPGTRNWGYDPAAFFAPDRTYGRPADLQHFVDAAHAEGLAVFLDVVYNHFGPDGAYAGAFAPFFTDKHETPWGQAVNLDDTHSEGVRHFFISNALYWLEEFRFDGLRLDATNALVDDSDPHFLEEMAVRVGEAFPDQKRYLIAEDDRNARHLIDPRGGSGKAGRPDEEGSPPEGRVGYGLDGVWADDFHHQVRNLTAGDDLFYFADFTDTTAAEIAETLRRGWFYTGQYASNFGKERGTTTDGLAPERFVVCIQNHDQVGNRPAGARLTEDISMPLYRAATAVLLFAPELPLLFMGQEWAASTPFQFFTDHHEELGKLVSEGRKEEFAEFAELTSGQVPDPQAESTFERSILRWDEFDDMPHAGMLAFYRDLLHLRPELPPAGPHGDREGERFHVEAHGDHGLALRRGEHVLLAALANGQTLPRPAEADVVLHSEDPAYTASGRELRFPDEGRSVRFERPGALVVRG
jgi:maltooligosyltrehalose trehalohydrolase